MNTTNARQIDSYWKWLSGQLGDVWTDVVYILTHTVHPHYCISVHTHTTKGLYAFLFPYVKYISTSPFCIFVTASLEFISPY